jgi:hypothetical protein
MSAGPTIAVRRSEVPTQVTAFVNANDGFDIEGWMDPKADALTARLRRPLQGIAEYLGFTHPRSNYNPNAAKIPVPNLKIESKFINLRTNTAGLLGSYRVGHEREPRNRGPKPVLFAGNLFPCLRCFARCIGDDLPIRKKESITVSTKFRAIQIPITFLPGRMPPLDRASVQFLFMFVGRWPSGKHRDIVRTRISDLVQA